MYWVVMESKHDGIHEAISTPSINISQHIFQKTGFKQRSDQGLNSPANIVQLSAWTWYIWAWAPFQRNRYNNHFLGKESLIKAHHILCQE